MSIRIALRVAVLASWSLASACSSSPHVPDGQTYAVQTKPFDGDLKAYASQSTVDVVLQHPGARFASSAPYPDCPALAGLATYTLKGGDVLLLAFTVRAEGATSVAYQRPARAPADPGLMDAMKREVCRL